MIPSLRKRKMESSIRNSARSAPKIISLADSAPTHLLNSRRVQGLACSAPASLPNDHHVGVQIERNCLAGSSPAHIQNDRRVQERLGLACSAPAYIPNDHRVSAHIGRNRLAGSSSAPLQSDNDHRVRVDGNVILLPSTSASDPNSPLVFDDDGGAEQNEDAADAGRGIIDDEYDTFERADEVNDALLHNRPIGRDSPAGHEHVERNEQRRKPKQTSALGQILNMEKQKMDTFINVLEDADRQYLLSLAPQLKKLSERNKMKVKIEIQQILLRYAEAEDN